MSASRRKQEAASRELEELVFGKDVVSAGLGGNSNNSNNNSNSNYNNSNNNSNSNKRKKGGNDASSARAVDSVWRDEDDEAVKVDLSQVNRLKKLKAEGESSIVSGEQLQSLLRKRYQSKELAWAQAEPEAEEAEGAAGVSSSMDEVLRSSQALIERKKQTAGELTGGKIDIARLTDANISSPSSDVISTIKFSKSGNLLLSGGLDNQLNIFNIDGDRNEKLLGLKLQDMSIMAAGFRGEEKVFLSGRKPYYYSYDLASGTVSKIAGLRTNLKSHEHMSVSPEGNMLAFAGAGGTIHMVSGTHNTWMYDIKMNSAVRSTTFLNEHTLISSGYDADVYMWDVRKTGRCLHRFAHDDGTSCHALAAYAGSEGGNFHLAVGAESGVVSLFNGSLGGPAPVKSKSLMNLTTNITSLAYHPSGEILAAASNEKKDAMRLIHVPTGTVFSNWPGQRTPLHKVTAIDFSPGGAYLAVGNRKGKVLLYRLKAYSNS